MRHVIAPNSTLRFGRDFEGSNDIRTREQNVAPIHAIIERFGDREQVRISPPPFSFFTCIIPKDGQANNIYIQTTMNVGDRVQFGSSLDDIFELALEADRERPGFVPSPKLMLRPKAQQQQQKQKTNTTGQQQQQKQDNRNDKNKKSGGGESRNLLLFRWIKFDGE